MIGPQGLVAIFAIVVVVPSMGSDGIKGLFETTGFHCYSRDSMKLPRHLHGKPQTTDPPFDLSVFDENGKRATFYEPGKIYNVKLEAYVHFRGLMLQPRLCTPSGHIIGSLRGGMFLNDEHYESHGIGVHQCGRLVTNDSITHTNDEKKFLAETKWTTSHDIGNVQFVATLATENILYWEKWRPKTAFLRSPTLRYIEPEPNVFVYSLHKEHTEEIVTTEPVLPSQHPLFEEQKEFLKGKMAAMKKIIVETSETSSDVFDDIDGAIFEGNPSVFEEGSAIIPKEVTAAGIEQSEETTPMTILQLTTSEIGVTQTSSKFADNGARETAFMVNRMFKKFGPLNDTVLGQDDLKFLNSHAHVQHDFVDNDIDMEEKCQNDHPCENDSKCVFVKGNIKCQCRSGFIGEHCKEIDKCVNHKCSNNSTCYNNNKSDDGYSCKCQNGSVGKYCEVECPSNQCENGGQCILNSFGKIACKCVPGTTGKRCEREINECGWGKCKNKAKCIDLFNDYKCECSDGWMGRTCERPCQDIYGSCRIWKREGQCEQMRTATDFFDINCAASCGICKISNYTDNSYLPIQPILLPFAWLLGEWESYVKGWNNHTTDYPTDMDGMAYNETITFQVSESLMFGTPYINYSAIMISEQDPTNVHQYNGFITIQQYQNENSTAETDRGALTTVGNTGIIMIEEGDIIEDKTFPNEGPTFMLTPSYIIYKDGTKPAKHPEKMKRWFTKKNNRLLQYMVREFKGRTHKFTKIYKKTKDVQFL